MGARRRQLQRSFANGGDHCANLQKPKRGVILQGRESRKAALAVTLGSALRGNRQDPRHWVEDDGVVL